MPSLKTELKRLQGLASAPHTSRPELYSAASCAWPSELRAMDTGRPCCHRALPSVAGDPGGMPDSAGCCMCCAVASAAACEWDSVSMASSMPTSPSSSTQYGALLGFWPTVHANTCGLCTHRCQSQSQRNCTHALQAWHLRGDNAKPTCMITSAPRT